MAALKKGFSGMKDNEVRKFMILYRRALIT